MSELRSVAVVGVGPIGEQHAEVWNERLRCRVTFVCDLNAARAQTVAAQLGFGGNPLTLGTNRQADAQHDTLGWPLEGLRVRP